MIGIQQQLLQGARIPHDVLWHIVQRTVPLIHILNLSYIIVFTVVPTSVAERSRNYLFSAPAPTLAIISAPAPPAIYWHLKLF